MGRNNLNTISSPSRVDAVSAIETRGFMNGRIGSFLKAATLAASITSLVSSCVENAPDDKDAVSPTISAQGAVVEGQKIDFAGYDFHDGGMTIRFGAPDRPFNIGLDFFTRDGQHISSKSATVNERGDVFVSLPAGAYRVDMLMPGFDEARSMVNEPANPFSEEI